MSAVYTYRADGIAVGLGLSAIFTPAPTVSQPMNPTTVVGPITAPSTAASGTQTATTEVQAALDQIHNADSNANSSSTSIPSTQAGGTASTPPPEDPRNRGSNTREELLNSVENPALRRVIEELYRPGANIGDGGTAAALKHEIQTGQALRHLIKAQERIRNIENIMSRQNLSSSDLQIANRLLRDLQGAVNMVGEWPMGH